MAKPKSTTNAVAILRNRYLKGRPKRKASVERERVHAQIARLIYDMRTEAGLSQRKLASLIGTTQSVISRLEDADYEGQSLLMLNRVAEALHKRITLTVTSADSVSA